MNMLTIPHEAFSSTISSLNSILKFTTHILQQSRRVANFASTSFTMSESQSDNEGEVSFLSACYLKVAEFPKLALKHGILLNLPI